MESGGSASCATFLRLGDLRVADFSCSLPFFFAEGLDLEAEAGRRENSSSEPELSSMMSLSGTAFPFPRERIFARSAMSSEYESMDSSSTLFCFS